MCYISHYSEQLIWIYKRRERKVPAHLLLLKPRVQLHYSEVFFHSVGKMLGILICILALHQVHTACVLEGVCPSDTSVQDEIVNQHNAFRRAVQPTAANMLRMNYSTEVAVSAQAVVDKCALAHGAPSTRMLDGYELGENLFYSSALTSWTDVISAWHSEVSRYSYPTGSTNGESVGHYTQVIWNSSYKVGCGVTLCSNGIYYYACHYYRAGNFEPYEPYKEGPSCGSCPDNCVDKLCTNPCPYINKYINCPTMKTIAGCSNKYVAAWCPASCKCTTEIIPIA